MNRLVDLNGEWLLYRFPQGSVRAEHPDDLRARGLRPIPATVPGNVELDLMAAGELDDPYVGDNITKLAPYERYEWWYEKEFEAPDPQGGTELVFHGVDCLAEYWLNGVRLGESGNMFIEHRFPATRRSRWRRTRAG